ncbi:Dynein heavy chain [Spironucleus salmonicida]|uniref:Dynein heavy chain n=1 Tax=Spironucleus salmonicida TaxID=348837 RepID=V6LDY3_9EUKA|nr:Dynein heavy chain [Spironucleus salmonicida]|eukprot:EST42705.1 Dynein heavy chain [Spironucleus salmonicida]
MDSEDGRILFLKQRVIQTLKPREEKWNKLIDQLDVYETLLQYFESTEVNQIFIYLDKQDNLHLEREAPSEFKKYALAFAKFSDQEKIQINNIKMIFQQYTLASKETIGKLQLLYGPLFQQFTDDLPESVRLTTHSTLSKLYLQLSRPEQGVAPVLPELPDEIYNKISNKYSKVPSLFQTNIGPERTVETQQCLREAEQYLLTWNKIILQEINYNLLIQYPHEELLFWSSKLSNLQDLEIQFEHIKVLSLKRFLTNQKSPLLEVIGKTLDTMKNKITECDNNLLFLKPLEEIFALLEDISQLSKVTNTFFKACSIITENSLYYNNQERIKMFFRSFINQLIKTIQQFLEFDNILKADPIDSLPLVNKAILLCKQIIQIYDIHYLSSWPFAKELFQNLNQFYNRLNDIKTMLQIWINLMKLEKLEVGGQNGELIFHQVTQIYNQFINRLMILQEPDYDPTDITQNKFDKVYMEFLRQFTEWEKRLIGILQMTLQQDNKIEFYCAVIQQFYGILEKSVLKATIIKQFSQFQKKFLIFMQEKLVLISEKYKTVLFSEQVRYNIQLQQVILEQFEKVQMIYESIDDDQVQQKLQSIEKQVQQISTNQNNKNQELFQQWLQQNDIQFQLSNQLYLVNIESINIETDLIKIQRHQELDEKYTLTLNYHSAIKDFFQDAHSFSLLGFIIPENLVEIIYQHSRFVNIQNELNIKFEEFNYIQKNLSSITKPLFYYELEQIIDVIQLNKNNLKWNSADYLIQEFIDKLDIISSLNMKVLQLRQFFKTQDQIVKQLTQLQLFIKIKSLFNLVDIQKQIPIKFNTIKEKHFDNTIEQLSQIKQSVTDSNLQNWDNFLMFQTQTLANQLIQLILFLSSKLMSQIDESEQFSYCDLFQKQNLLNENAQHSIEIQAILRPPIALCDPSITDIDGRITLEKLFLNIFDEICQLGKYLPNLSEYVDQKYLRQNEYKNYVIYCQTAQEVTSQKNKIRHKIQRRCKLVQEEMNILQKYYYLYEIDKKQFLQSYLTYGPNINWQGIPEESKLQETQKVIREQQIQGEDEVTTIKSEIDVQYYREPDLYDFNDTLKRFQQIGEELSADLPLQKRLGWILLNFRPVRRQLQQSSDLFKQMFLQHLVTSTQQQLENYERFFDESLTLLQKAEQIPMGLDFEQLLRTYKQVKSEERVINQKFEPLKNTLQLLKSLEANYPEQLEKLIETQPNKWINVKQVCLKQQEYIYSKQQEQGGLYQEQYYEFAQEITIYKEKYLQNQAFSIQDNDEAYCLIDNVYQYIENLLLKALIYDEKLKIFDFSTQKIPEIDIIDQLKNDLKLLKTTRDVGDMIQTWFSEFGKSLFKTINTEILEDNIKALTKEFKNINKNARKFEYYKYLDNLLKNFSKLLPIINNLRSPAVEEKHINQIKEITGKDINLQMSFNEIVQLGLGEFEEEIVTVVAKAEKELTIVEYMRNLGSFWQVQEFSFIRVGDQTGQIMTVDDVLKDKESQLYSIMISEDLNDTLESDLMTLGQMLANKLLTDSHPRFKEWQNKLVILDSVIQTWLNDQKVWSYLYPIFMLSDDIKQQMPEETIIFQKAHSRYITEIKYAIYHPVALQLAIKENFLGSLEEIQLNLHTCEKKLNDYLDQKRKIFPRFFFISSVDLLDILSKSNQPILVEKHLSKLTDNTKNMLWNGDKTIGMESSEGEKVNFPEIHLIGPVEIWMEQFLVSSRNSLMQLINQALIFIAENNDKLAFLNNFPAQITLLALQIVWTQETFAILEKAELGDDVAVKEYNKKQNEQLLEYIKLIQTTQDKQFRQKISTICTIEVHNKDVVSDLAKQKVDTPNAFQWQCQLKFHYTDTCFSTICDARFQYSYEYLGNNTRLVITPLTDRCYITLTQSLHLMLGGAPAGPAGTGKTETTKDLGKALGRMVYVFNCSPEMDFKSLGSIFYGLAISGSWGCFDEFNRIEVEVLSVVAMQVKTVLDAIRAQKIFFSLDQDEENPTTRLNSDVGYFITMNPGYAGRTELPDNLKALFRGVAMVVPDFCQITEIMLVSNGFISARNLAKKFTTLYSLNRELLSKQDHYDWGLRAIIAICRTAGMLRREMIK